MTPATSFTLPVAIANGILFLLSDKADYAAAAALDIDSALSMSVMNRMPGRKVS